MIEWKEIEKSTFSNKFQHNLKVNLKIIVSLTYRSRNNKSQLCANHHRRHCLLVARQCCSGRWHLSFAHDTLGTCVPVPEENGAVRGTGGYVAVGSDVALGPRQTRDHAKVAKDNLHDLGRLRGENPETVVPETACNQEATVHGGHEAVGPDFQHLAEVVAKMAAHHRVVVVVGVGLSLEGNRRSLVRIPVSIPGK